MVHESAATTGRGPAEVGPLIETTGRRRCPWTPRTKWERRTMGTVGTVGEGPGPRVVTVTEAATGPVNTGAESGPRPPGCSTPSWERGGPRG